MRKIEPALIEDILSKLMRSKVITKGFFRYSVDI